MSLRIAAALAVTIGAGILMSTAAQARPEMVGMRSAEYSPGTIVVRTGERRLYLILDSGRAMRYPVGVGRYGKQWAGYHPHRRQIFEAGLVAAEGSQARQAEHAGCDSRRFAAQSDGCRGDDAFRR